MALPVALAVLGTAEMLSLHVPGAGYGVAGELLAAGLLVFRRQYPLVAGTGAAAVLLVLPWLGPQLDEPATPILFWAVAIYALARWIEGLSGLVGVLTIGLLVLVDYVLGRITRRLALQKEMLEEHQELVRREAVRAERDRIARELHDVIAHSISCPLYTSPSPRDS